MKDNRNVGELLNEWNVDEAKGIDPRVASQIKQVKGIFIGAFVALEKIVKDNPSMGNYASAMSPIKSARSEVDDMFEKLLK